MAKKKPAKSPSPQKRGNAKTKSKRLALDNDTDEAALEAAIARQRKAFEDGEELEKPDFSYPVETLLEVPNRKPLEDPGLEVLSNNGLIRFVIDRPEYYKRFIQKLRDGATLDSAVLSCKFQNPKRVKEWLAQGIKDADEDKDSYYSRLYYDVAGAIAEKSTEVEILVAEDDPKFWLQRGPRKYINTEWQNPVTAKALPNGMSQEPEKLEGENVLKIENKPVHNEDEIEGEVLGRAPVEESQYERAARILKEAGHSPEQNPDSWSKACRTQAGEQLDDSDLEVKDEDEDSPISLGSNESILTEQQRQAQSSYPH
jgi:hypothetical protein